MFSRFTFAAAAAALFGAATAGQLSIVSPGGSDLWWGESLAGLNDRENGVLMVSFFTCDFAFALYSMISRPVSEQHHLDMPGFALWQLYHPVRPRINCIM